MLLSILSLNFTDFTRNVNLVDITLAIISVSVDHVQKSSKISIQDKQGILWYHIKFKLIQFILIVCIYEKCIVNEWAKPQT